MSKVSNLEYSSKTHESRIDDIKSKLNSVKIQVETQASSIQALSNTVAHSSGPHHPTHSTVDTEARELVKQLKTKVKNNNASIQDILQEISDRVEELDTELATVTTRLSNSKIDDSHTNQKIDTLFKLVYSLSPRSDYINSLCPSYNCQVVVQPQPPNESIPIRNRR